jgi:hypothetical protein
MRFPSFQQPALQVPGVLIHVDVTKRGKATRAKMRAALWQREEEENMVCSSVRLRFYERIVA